MSSKQSAVEQSAGAELVVRTEEQVHQVYRWIIDGFCQHDIEQSIREKWPRQKTRPLIVAAMDRIMKQANPDPSVMRGWAIAGTQQIYQKAMDVADFQTALRALKQVVELSKG